MRDETKLADQSGMDKGLVAMFLRMSPDERLRANVDAFRTILELKDAYERGRKFKDIRSGNIGRPPM